MEYSILTLKKLGLKTSLSNLLGDHSLKTKMKGFYKYLEYSICCYLLITNKS